MVRTGFGAAVRGGLMPFAGVCLGLVATVLGGCSGAGVSPAGLTDSPVRTLCADHMTTVQFVRSWLAVQYPPPLPPPTQDPVTHTESLDADTDHVWGTDSYGNPFDLMENSDGSGSGTWVSDGQTVRGVWDSPVQESPNVISQHQTYEYPGMTLDYTSTTTFPQGGGCASFRRVGTETLADGRVLLLEFANNGLGEERTHLTRPDDGLDIEFAVPVAAVPGRSWQPLPVSSVDGNAQTSLGPMTFALQGSNATWERWEFAGPEGITGAFGLHGGAMAGSGRLEQSGTLRGVLNWDVGLGGRLDLMAIGVVEVTPSAAARDFAIDQWLRDWSGLGPMATE
jgi:hypothetical protein